MDARDFVLKEIRDQDLMYADVARYAGISRQYLYSGFRKGSRELSFNVVNRVVRALGFKIVAVPFKSRIPNGAVELEDIEGESLY